MKFLSIIIPAYNSGKTIGDALQSICNQNMNDDIEVIVSDDCSTEPYDDVLDKYRDRLEIKYVKTDYNCCPANTRQRGAENATARWLTFMDHDDILLPNTLPLVKKELEESGEEYYAVSPFVEIEPFTNQIVRKMDGHSGWTHGKFINRKNMWEAFNLRYKTNLTSHEDIFMSSEINCVMSSLERKAYELSVVVYAWRRWPKSQSKSTYYGDDGQPHDFLQVFYKDYIDSTGTVYLDRYDEGLVSKEYAMASCIEVIAYCYFYQQGFIFREPLTYLKRTNDEARTYVKRVIDTFDIGVADMLKWYAAEGCLRWDKLREVSRIATGHIIEPESFLMWIRRITKEV